MRDIGHTKLWQLLHRNDGMLICCQHMSASWNKSVITGSPAVFLQQDLCPAQSSGWFCSLNAALVIISFHYHSTCFPILSYSLSLYLVCSIQLLPAWITLEVPNLTVHHSQPLTCLASHFCKAGKCSPPYSRWGMEAQGSRDLKVTEKICKSRKLNMGLWPQLPGWIPAPKKSYLSPDLQE